MKTRIPGILILETGFSITGDTPHPVSSSKTELREVSRIPRSNSVGWWMPFIKKESKSGWMWFSITPQNWTTPTCRTLQTIGPGRLVSVEQGWRIPEFFRMRKYIQMRGSGARRMIRGFPCLLGSESWGRRFPL